MGHDHGAASAFGWIEGTVLVAVILAAVLLLAWAYRRSERHGDGLTIEERRSLDGTRREVPSMVRQYGTPVAQSRIMEEAPGGFDHVRDVLVALEAKRLIAREWDPETDELMVSA
jgi:hypothetical protein